MRNITFGGSKRYKIKFVEKVVFTKHLAIMIKSGISLAEAINTLSIQTKGTTLGDITESLEKDIENGMALAKALKRFPKVFDEFYISMVEVGEVSGTLEENLDFLSKHLAKEDALNKKIKGALLYPVIVLVAAGLMGMFISLYILPQFVDFFDAFSIELPWTTRVLLGVANFMKEDGVFFFSTLFVAIVFMNFVVNLKPIKPTWHKFKLKLPLFGKLIAYGSLANFARNFSVLLSSGITVTQSLEITAQTLSNIVYKRQVMKMNISLKKGKSLSNVIEREMGKEFPILVSRMIGVGEKTGNLEETLEYLADFYEDEIDGITKQITTVLEPIMLLVIGLVVGFVALAIITPIYELTGSIQG